MAVESEKALRDRCPKADYPMRIDHETGIAVVAHTGLCPVYFIKSVPERGWNAGEVHGLSPANAALNLKNGNGMELVGASDQVGRKAEKKVAAKTKEPAAAPPAAPSPSAPAA